MKNLAAADIQHGANMNRIELDEITGEPKGVHAFLEENGIEEKGPLYDLIWRFYASGAATPMATMFVVAAYQSGKCNGIWDYIQNS